MGTSPTSPIPESGGIRSGFADDEIPPARITSHVHFDEDLDTDIPNEQEYAYPATSTQLHEGETSEECSTQTDVYMQEEASQSEDQETGSDVGGQEDIYVQDVSIARQDAGIQTEEIMEEVAVEEEVVEELVEEEAATYEGGVDQQTGIVQEEPDVVGETTTSEEEKQYTELESVPLTHLAARVPPRPLSQPSPSIWLFPPTSPFPDTDPILRTGLMERSAPQQELPAVSVSNSPVLNLLDAPALSPIPVNAMPTRSPETHLPKIVTEEPLAIDPVTIAGRQSTTTFNEQPMLRPAADFPALPLSKASSPHYQELRRSKRVRTSRSLFKAPTPSSSPSRESSATPPPRRTHHRRQRSHSDRQPHKPSHRSSGPSESSRQPRSTSHLRHTQREPQTQGHLVPSVVVPHVNINITNIVNEAHSADFQPRVARSVESQNAYRGSSRIRELTPEVLSAQSRHPQDHVLSNKPSPTSPETPFATSGRRVRRNTPVIHNPKPRYPYTMPEMSSPSQSTYVSAEETLADTSAEVKSKSRGRKTLRPPVSPFVVPAATSRSVSEVPGPRLKWPRK